MRDTRYDEIFLYFEEEGHKYTDTLGNEYLSVTTFLGRYGAEFDVRYWVHKKAKEQGVSEKEIIKQWDRIKNEACVRGTKTHNGIEDAINEVSQFKNAIRYLTNISSGRKVTVADIPFFKANPLDVEGFIEATDNKYPEIYSVFKYYADRGYTIYSEIGAFLIDYLISGTIDILCYREDGFVILDWKTNRDGLKFESGYFKKDKSVVPNQLTNEWVHKREMMKAPLSHLEECNGNHYAMQLSMYSYMVETILEIPNKGIALCHIGSPFILNKYGQPYRDKNGYHVDPDGKETVKWFPLTYKRNECLAILNDRKNELLAKSVTNGTNQLELPL